MKVNIIFSYDDSGGGYVGSDCDCISLKSDSYDDMFSKLKKELDKSKVSFNKLLSLDIKVSKEES